MMKKFVSLLVLLAGFAFQTYADKVTGSITPPK